MNPKWSKDHPAVQAWLEYHYDMKDRREQVRQRMGIKQPRWSPRKQWTTLGIVCLFAGAVHTQVTYNLSVVGLVILMGVAISLPKGW